MQYGRRRFLKRTGTAAGAVLLPVAAGLTSSRARAADFGPLVPDPNGLLDLPEGFTYRIIQEATGQMSDGFSVPGLPDAMACFVGDDGNWILMRNQEVPFFDIFHSPYPIGQAPPEAFDPDGLGGVSRVVIDPKTLDVISSNLVLAGTVRNCAGGVSPWGWMTCEEAGDDDGHGYVFLCDPNASSVQPAQQIVGYGRFNHEATVVDPVTHIAYETEDRGNGCFYRFVPLDPCEPFVGRLQALRVVDEPGALTGGWEDGRIATIDWVDIDEPNPAGDTVRVEAAGKGAALFRRGEGAWFHDGACWFVTTEGGPEDLGQVWRLVDGPDGGMLELVAQSHGSDEFDMPDNIVITPWGQPLLCEDGSGENLLRLLQEDGTTSPMATNSEAEFAGACFSPDGRVLFLNIQFTGRTLAITGPFPDPVPVVDEESECPDDGGVTGGADETGADDTGDEMGDDDTGASMSDGNEGTGSASATGASASGGSGDSDGGSSGEGSAGAAGTEEGCGCNTDSQGPLSGVLAVGVAALLVRGRDDEPQGT